MGLMAVSGYLLLLGLVAGTLTRSTGAQHIPYQERIWSIAIGHDWGGHEYFDDQGYLKGFGIGLIDLVCSAGKMDCRIIWDQYSNCWDSDAGQHPYGGKGLMGGWYDACTGWVPTVERIHTFTFSKPWINKLYSYFYVLKGTNFDTSNLTGKRIAFVDGWASNEQCVARQTGIRGNRLDVNQIKHYSYPEDVTKALQAKEVDAAFADDLTWSKDQMGKLDRLSLQASCYLDGNGMMVRKDNSFTQHWNSAFSRLREGNKFNKYCAEANVIHELRGKVHCINF